MPKYQQLLCVLKMSMRDICSSLLWSRKEDIPTN